MHTFFSQISPIHNRNPAIEIEIISNNTTDEFDPYVSRAYISQSIIAACTSTLLDAKPLLLSNFHHLNSQVLCQELYNEAITNYEVFSMNMIEGFTNGQSVQYNLFKEYIL